MLARAAIVTIILVTAGPMLAAPPDVHLEVLLEDRMRVGEPQRWLGMLDDMPFASVRMRQARAGEAPEIDRPSKTNGPIRIRGLLSSKGILRVPDEQFRFSDRGRMRRWIEELKVGDVEPPVAFGLTANELLSVRRELSTPVIQKTLNQPLSKVVDDVRSNLTIAIRMDPTATTRIRLNQPVEDELTGLSSGTALAAALRPMGLAIVPKRSADDSISLRIVPGRNASEAWPVGWDLDKPNREALPKLFDFLQVEIVATPLDEALLALQKRLDVPFLLDHNSMAARNINPSEKQVRFPSKRTFYKRVLDQLLFQARLEAQPRIDDAGEPFIWITTIGR